MAAGARTVAAALLLAVLLVAVGPTCHGARQPPEDLYDRPIIGILSQPGSPAPDGMSYIAASYVKWVEAAGARVVPIFYDMSRAEVEDRFKLINGLLIPGGGANLTPGHQFYDTASMLVDMAVKANDKGDYFPVQGTCLGMETLSIIITQNYTVLSKYDAYDAAAPLLYTDEARDSYFLRSLPKDVRKALQDQPIAMENHGKGLSMAAMKENPKLAAFFKPITLSLDKSGESYISTLEARDYPIVATQWHPEKNPFEWTPDLHIPHSFEAVRMSQEVANYFVNEARNSLHRSNGQVEEDDLLIYNWPAAYTGRKKHDGEETDFAQCFFFPNSPSTKPEGRMGHR